MPHVESFPPGIKHTQALALETWSLNHWAAREVRHIFFLTYAVIQIVSPYHLIKSNLKHRSYFLLFTFQHVRAN